MPYEVDRLAIYQNDHSVWGPKGTTIGFPKGTQCSFSIFVHELSRHLLGLYRYVTEMNILLAKKLTMGMQEHHPKFRKGRFKLETDGRFSWLNRAGNGGTKRRNERCWFVSDHLKEDS